MKCIWCLVMIHTGSVYSEDTAGMKIAFGVITAGHHKSPLMENTPWGTDHLDHVQHIILYDLCLSPNGLQALSHCLPAVRYGRLYPMLDSPNDTSDDITQRRREGWSHHQQFELMASRALILRILNVAAILCKTWCRPCEDCTTATRDLNHAASPAQSWCNGMDKDTHLACTCSTMSYKQLCWGGKWENMLAGGFHQVHAHVTQGMHGNTGSC